MRLFLFSLMLLLFGCDLDDRVENQKKEPGDAAPGKPQEVVAVETPSSITDKPLPDSNVFIIVIKKDLLFTKFNGDKIVFANRNELAAFMKKHAEDIKKHEGVAIQASSDVPFKDVRSIIEMLEEPAVGIYKFSLVTEMDK